MKTLALVIGNNDYYLSAKLDNAVSDATAMFKIFERLGYDVIFKANCVAKDYTDLLTEFETRIESYDASIFYFAGHGFEINGENYLAAIDCQITNANKYHCGQTCIKLSEILSILKKNTNKANIVIIDACRKSFERSGAIGFSPIQAPKGTLLAFSTSPNEGASDTGFEGHSIFTGAILRYIGRERISVEELFKKVRKTVYNISEGQQTTWEHTSLIGDYFFNTGQLVHSISIPYDEKVVKDANYNNNTDDFGKLILKVKSYNWNIQNPAIEELLKIPLNQLDKNQQFILGRNLLQASGAARNAETFMKNIKPNIEKYNLNNENHVLNGILFEIYFNSHADFRKDKTKKYYFEEIMVLRKFSEFKSAFDFIQNLLRSTQDKFIYIPQFKDDFIDIDIIASTEKHTNLWGEEETYQVISKITYNSIDITKQIAKYGVTGLNGIGITQTIADFLSAPQELIQIHNNIELEKIAFTKTIIDKDEFSF
ncbi:MAG: caspase family protein [Bacteroidia bacterium]